MDEHEHKHESLPESNNESNNESNESNESTLLKKEDSILSEMKEEDVKDVKETTIVPIVPIVLESIHEEKQEKQEKQFVPMSRQKSMAIVAITQITFKQIFENMLCQNIKEINGREISIKHDIRNYFIYMCKERTDFFTAIDESFSAIINKGVIELKDVPTLLNLVMTAYNNLKIDKEQLNNADPVEIIKLLFELVVMLFIDTNEIENGELYEDIMKAIEASIGLIMIKPIKSTVPQKLTRLFHT